MTSSAFRQPRGPILQLLMATNQELPYLECSFAEIAELFSILL